MIRQNQLMYFMANNKPFKNYANFSQIIRKWYYQSETALRYLIYNFYGRIPPTSRFHYKFTKLKIHHKANRNDKILNQIKTNNHIKNLPKRSPFDRLFGTQTTSNTPLYLKKYRRTINNANFALVTLAIQNSISEEEIHWSKLSSLLRQLYNEENKNKKEKYLINNDHIFKLDHFNFNRYIGKGCNAAIYEATLKQSFSNQFNIDDKFAIKMLFNYNVESNAFSIINSMKKECVPYDGSFGVEIDSLIKSRVKLPEHPNIVKMYGVFVDQIPELPKAKELFKNALPPRLSTEGYGRNATLFLVMKRYDLNLKEYLKSNLLTGDQSLSLLTQLFSAIEHLEKNFIAHRDLKTDNILLDFCLDKNYPALVLTDFGLCSTSLTLPYLNDEMCICGNSALTAPEIINAVPGVFSRLDYHRSDLWACGAIAYECYNNCNPFYPNEKNFYLNSSSYKEDDLPKPLNMPIYIQALVRQILSREPSKRPTTKICTTLCNLLMFCDELSLKCIANTELSEKQLMKKINLLLSDTLFFARKKLNKMQLKLKLIFLMDLEIASIKDAIKYFEI